MFKPFFVDTIFGQVEVTVIDGHHVNVSAGSSGKNYIMFRGENYYVSLHLGLAAGQWRQHVDRLSGIISQPYVTRSLGANAPLSYAKKIVAELTARVNAYLTANPAVLEQAQEAKLESDVARLEGEAEELQAKLDIALDALNNARVELRGFRNR